MQSAIEACVASKTNTSYNIHKNIIGTLESVHNQRAAIYSVDHYGYFCEYLGLPQYSTSSISCQGQLIKMLQLYLLFL